MQDELIEDAPRSKIKIFFSFVLIVMIIASLVFYWFVPFRTIEFVNPFSSNPENTNFSSLDMQFYPNMRYVDSSVSYKIYNCSLKKKEDMLEAFDIISNKTILGFYSVSSNEEISVFCEDKPRVENGLFIAGEGGPTNITKAGEFNLILNGRILLIKNVFCPDPIVAIHELLHTFGFDHSLNSANMMYKISRCNQELGQDTIDFINNIYSIPNYSDLAFENLSANIKGRYLSTNITIRNKGLSVSGNSSLVIFADDSILKTINLKEIYSGYGFEISLKNIWIKKLNFKNIRFLIKNDFNELDKKNNEGILKVE